MRFFNQWFNNTLLFLKKISGSNALSCFAAANSQKYFLRQVKLMDTGFYQTPIIKRNSEKSESEIKQKPILKKAKVPEKPNAALLSLYGHILACARSYVGAIGKLLLINA